MKLFSPLVKTFLRLMIFKTKSRLRSPLNSIFPRLHHPWPRLNGRSPGFRKTALPSMSWSCLGHTSSFLLSPSPDYSILIHGSCSTLYFRKTGLPVTPRRGGQSARVCASKEHSLCLSLDLSQSLFLYLFHITHILLSSICVSVVPQAYEVRDMLHLLRLHLVASNKAQIPWLNQIGVFFFTKTNSEGMLGRARQHCFYVLNVPGIIVLSARQSLRFIPNSWNFLVSRCRLQTHLCPHPRSEQKEGKRRVAATVSRK